MFHVYIIYSEAVDRYYIGQTAEAISERIRKHNSATKGFTGKATDWKLVYSEVMPSRTDAIQREREIKCWKSRKMIEKLIS